MVSWPALSEMGPGARARTLGDLLLACVVKDCCMLACSASALLCIACCASVLQFGSIAHSHLNQCGRNLLLGAKTENQDLACASGRGSTEWTGSGPIDVKGVELHHPSMIASFRQGLCWEVLSWRMVQEEPEAVSIIQAACNIKGGLQMQEHEMQAILRLARFCEAEMQLAGKVQYDKVREDLRHTMPDVACASEFTALLAFVVDLGALGSSFLVDLRDFHSQWVNAKKRRLRASSFAAVSELPARYPHVKVAVIKVCYSETKGHQLDIWLDGVSSADINKMKKAALAAADAAENMLDLAEGILRFFHVLASRTNGFGMPEKTCCDVLTHLDVAVGRVCLKRKGMPAGFEQCESLEDVADAAYARIKKSGLENMPAKTWNGRDALSAPAVVASSSSAPAEALQTLQPKVLKFEDGVAVTGQDVLREKERREETCWSNGFNRVFEETQLFSARTLVFQALQCVATEAPILTEADLQIWTLGKQGTNVFAQREFAVGELFLLPMSFDVSNIVEKTQHPHAVPCGVDSLGLYITPSMKQPAMGPAKDRAAPAAKDGFLPLFWVMRRVPPTDEDGMKLVNCSIVMVDTTMVMSTGLGVSPLDRPQNHAHKTCLVQVPVMTNHRVIQKGEILAVRGPVKAAKEKTQRQQTWRDNAAKKSRT